MGVPRRTPEELEASAMEAYRRYDEGQSLREIAVAMSGAPHFCGGHTTARRWIRRGFELAVNAPGATSPELRREARRRSTDGELDELRAEMAADATAGRLDRAVMYRLNLDAIKTQIHLEGLRRPPEPSVAQVNVSGAADVQVDPALLPLLRALAAIPANEWQPDDEGGPDR